jgi:hypothetical protein
MRKFKWMLLGSVSAVLVVMAYGQADSSQPAVTNLVKNGSFENPRSTWMDTTCNYMSLTAGSKSIPGWTVTTSTINEIVWAMTPTCDGHTAASGTFFLDLTGFGGDSPNGGVQQTLSNLTIGQKYLVYLALQGSLPLVTIDSAPVTLTAGTPFVKGNDTWTPEYGVFTAASTNPVLEIQNQSSGQQIVFIDSVFVRAR